MPKILFELIDFSSWAGETFFDFLIRTPQRHSNSSLTDFFVPDCSRSWERSQNFWSLHLSSRQPVRLDNVNLVKFWKYGWALCLPNQRFLWAMMIRWCLKMLTYINLDLVRVFFTHEFRWRNWKHTFPLTVGLPSANSDKHESNWRCRKNFSLPCFVVRLTKCLLGDYSWYHHPHGGCWVSPDPDADVVFRLVFSKQEVELCSWVEEAQYC